MTIKCETLQVYKKTAQSRDCFPYDNSLSLDKSMRMSKTCLENTMGDIMGIVIVMKAKKCSVIHGICN